MVRAGQAVALCVIALLTLGVVMVNSAGLSVVPTPAVPDALRDAGVVGPPRPPRAQGPVEATGSPGLGAGSVLLSRPAAYMVLALAALGAASLLPIRGLARLVPEPGDASTGGNGARVLAACSALTLGMLALLLLVYMPVIGREVNGSHRWVRVPGAGDLSLQPSEVVKWLLVGTLAFYAAARRHVIHRFWGGLVPGLLIVGPVVGLILLEDLGTAALVGGVACVVLLGAGARFWQFLLLAPGGLAVLAWAILGSEYRFRRLTAFLDPWADPQGSGYHMIQSMLAVAGGEGFGRGLGHGLQKFGYLPEDTTDFLFAVICEELGIAGAAVVVALYIGLLWSASSIVRREPSPVLRLVGLGVMATVGLQAVINLAVVTGLGPTKGIPLPLLSSGGTSWIMTAGSLGLLIAMDRAQRRDATDPRAEPDPGDRPDPGLAPA